MDEKKRGNRERARKWIREHPDRNRENQRRYKETDRGKAYKAAYRVATARLREENIDRFEELVAEEFLKRGFRKGPKGRQRK